MTEYSVSGDRVTKNRSPLLILVFFALFVCFVWLLFTVLGDNVNYFKTPSLLTLADRQDGRYLRLGGTVETGSINQQGSDIVFYLNDGTLREKIRFQGVLPDLFREGQGVVVDGHFIREGDFVAIRVLAKHDENYMSSAGEHTRGLGSVNNQGWRYP